MLAKVRKYPFGPMLAKVRKYPFGPANIYLKKQLFFKLLKTLKTYRCEMCQNV